VVGKWRKSAIHYLNSLIRTLLNSPAAGYAAMLAPIAKTILGLVAMVPAILVFLVARTLERRHYVLRVWAAMPDETKDSDYVGGSG
jgi:hypothetical protein